MQNVSVCSYVCILRPTMYLLDKKFKPRQSITEPLCTMHRSKCLITVYYLKAGKAEFLCLNVSTQEYIKIEDEIINLLRIR